MCPICWSGYYKKQAQSDFPNLSAPALRALLNAKVTKLSHLTRFTKEQVAELHGMGPNGLSKLQAALRKRRLHFKSPK